MRRTRGKSSQGGRKAKTRFFEEGSRESKAGGKGYAGKGTGGANRYGRLRGGREEKRITHNTRRKR